MRRHIRLKNLNREDLKILSSEALNQEITIQDYFKKIIRNEAKKLREEKQYEDKDIVELLKDMAK
ncbi:MAG: hypothetical protein N4A57_07935 [Anaeromicrobium sp.]|jgi:hypothetical protein|uniref:hypothetical protein n=1 Tax=Anaeromicrobium sp. TaxID=1929132 RepID=UPI0025DB5D4D|nr:hypothetical protein [Anaeromicrobium sp.]MCT4594180.1 hypothetical protein [Anaeromicrobium sp.]